VTEDIYGTEVATTLRQAQDAARSNKTKLVSIDGERRAVPYPYPSPGDWRDCWIYFLMIDRFNNPDRPPNSTVADPPSEWDQRYDFRQGGSFNGITEQLDYIHSLGARAIWLSPVLKNSKPDWRWNYHGYGAQDFLAVDERFSSDGTRETAEQELQELVEQAHARGLYVILDIVLNHSARVFDYVLGGWTVQGFSDQDVMFRQLGTEPPVQWLNGFGYPRSDWLDHLPSLEHLSADDAIWPADLQNPLFFRRRGGKLSDDPGVKGFVPGDFGDMRQLVVEYNAESSDQRDIRDKYGPSPVLTILVRAYEYLIAKYDFDGFRIDTVKYVHPRFIQIFGNAIREYGQSIGKRNFFTFGEIFDDESTIASFVGRNGGDSEGYGIDAALDFPLHFKLPEVAKSSLGVETIRQVFEDRKRESKELLSSHGEAGRFFVSFLDNHDQKHRFNHPDTPEHQITLAMAALFTLQGIPCLYYGTEQGLHGTRDKDGKPDLSSLESVREALWGKRRAFDKNHHLYGQIRDLSLLRDREPALRYGRLYFRQLSGNSQDFGHSSGNGGILAYSRILSDRELLVVANTNFSQSFTGHVLVDRDLNRGLPELTVAYSNRQSEGSQQIEVISEARFFENGRLVGMGNAAAVQVQLQPMEIQIIIPK